MQVADAASCGNPRKKNRYANLRKIAGLPPSILTGNERRCGSTVSSRRGSDRSETEPDRQHCRCPNGQLDAGRTRESAERRHAVGVSL